MSVDRNSCVTCGDTAVTARVVDVERSTATVDVDGRLEQVGIELVETVEPGDLLLCHAGIAIERIDPQ